MFFFYRYPYDSLKSFTFKSQISTIWNATQNLCHSLNNLKVVSTETSKNVYCLRRSIPFRTSYTKYDNPAHCLHLSQNYINERLVSLYSTCKHITLPGLFERMETLPVHWFGFFNSGLLPHLCTGFLFFVSFPGALHAQRLCICRPRRSICGWWAVATEDASVDEGTLYLLTSFLWL